MVEPYKTGIGGDAFALLLVEPRGRRLVGLNGSGRAPAAATRRAYRARGLDASPQGILSVDRAGRGPRLGHALAALRPRSLGDVLAPAIAYAEDGFR